MSLSMFVRTGALVVGTTALGACDIFSPRACTMEARPAISLDIRDSVSDTTIAESFRAIARDGAFADTALFRPGPYSVMLAHERAGTYTVTVEKEGYRPWSRTSVRVRNGECHVQTVDLIARLKR